MTDDQTGKPAKDAPAADKRARLSEALRENLKRRKAQARARKAEAGKAVDELGDELSKND